MSFIALNKLFEEDLEAKEKAEVKAQKEKRKAQRERIKKEKMSNKKQ